VAHVQTALRLRTKVIACNASNLFSETALDAMSIAAFLVTGKGRVRHMNQLAAVYLQGGDSLLLHDGRLTANDSRESARLELLIAGAALSGRNGSEAVPGGAIKISRLHTQSTLQVTVIPVPKGNQIADGDSSALVFVSDPSSSPRPRTALMRQLYGLTPAEGRVADLLLEGFDVREVAGRLGISLETCRFHVKRILVKTGTRRQSELMRLMVSLPA
jgi:DNA-binding CsgD family transcriptional regulator